MMVFNELWVQTAHQEYEERVRRCQQEHEFRRGRQAMRKPILAGPRYQQGWSWVQGAVQRMAANRRETAGAKNRLCLNN